MSKKVGQIDSRRRQPLREADIQGLNYLQSLRPLLERLRPVGTTRDRAGNRRLFMDQYCALILLFLFNPVVRSLRSLQQASQLRNVQRKLKVSRASLGSDLPWESWSGWTAREIVILHLPRRTTR